MFWCTKPINNLSPIQLEKNNHELDYIEKNILVHPDIPLVPLAMAWSSKHNSHRNSQRFVLKWEAELP